MPLVPRTRSGGPSSSSSSSSSAPDPTPNPLHFDTEPRDQHPKHAQRWTEPLDNRTWDESVWSSFSDGSGTTVRGRSRHRGRRDSSVGGSLRREMSPDDWTLRMLKRQKARPSLGVQAELASSPPSFEILSMTSSSSSDDSLVALDGANGQRRASASDILQAHTLTRTGPHRTRSGTWSTASSPEGHSAAHLIFRSVLTPLDSNAHVATGHDSIKRREGTEVTSEPLGDQDKVPLDAQSGRRASTGPGGPTAFPNYGAGHLLQVAAGHTATFLYQQAQLIQHHVMPVRDASGLEERHIVENDTKEGPRSLVSWDQVDVVSVQFRAGAEGHEGCNAWLLGMQNLNATRSGRRASARQDKHDEGVIATAFARQDRELDHAVEISAASGKPARVTIVLKDGRRSVAFVDGLTSAEITRTVLARRKFQATPAVAVA